MEPGKCHALRAHIPEAATDRLNPLSLGTMSASAYIENLGYNSARLINYPEITYFTLLGVVSSHVCHSSCTTSFKQ